MSHIGVALKKIYAAVADGTLQVLHMQGMSKPQSLPEAVTNYLGTNPA